MKRLLIIIFGLLLCQGVSAEQLQSLELSTSSMVAGQTTMATITLTEPAPTGGLDVEIWLDQHLAAPTWVRVPEGQSTATFPLTSTLVLGTSTVKLAALTPTSSAQAELELLPENLAQR